MDYFLHTARKWSGRYCADCFSQQDGCASISRLQPRHGRFLHGIVPRIFGHCRCRYAWRVQKTRYILAIFRRMSSKFAYSRCLKITEKVSFLTLRAKRAKFTFFDDFWHFKSNFCQLKM